ncbi:hypothetical protein BJ742DRAFT_317956 [Cladochytrium replicatum]|nr:hypothetical protein BJ742DRAFT_317956 [Cladochytrium replicatum]
MELQSITGGGTSSNASKRGTLRSRRSSTMTARSTAWSSGRAAMIYLKGFLRSSCYVVNIVMTFLSIGGFFPLLTGTPWTFYGLCVVFLVMMTDASRFQQALELLQKQYSDGPQSMSNNPGSSIEKRGSSTGPPSAMIELDFSKYADDEVVTVSGGKTQTAPDTGKVMRTSVMGEDQRHTSFSIA